MDLPAAFLTSEGTELLLLAEEIGRIGIIDWDVRTGSVRLSPKALAMYGLEVSTAVTTAGSQPFIAKT
jgi:hypothetical protein